MDKTAYLSYLEVDYRRLREVAADQLTAKVPSCPEWTVADLVVHVAQVYGQKTATMRTGKEQPRPPDLGGAEPIPALDRAYTDLVAELTSREPGEPSLTWYTPDQTVGFWQRRMAQETVIHRVDAELAAGARRAPIPEDIALDGIDEVLVCFLSWGSHEYPEYHGEDLAGSDGRAVLVDAGTTQWSVRLAPTGIDVTLTGETSASVTGAPDELLLWLWRRIAPESVDRSGDPALITRLWQLLGTATQ